MNDLISRKEAIDEADEWMDAYSADMFEDVRLGIQQVKRSLRKLPSAQPEKRTQERTETHACDLISRAMLLEYIHNEPVGKMLCDKYNLDGVIKQLPSAQPESSDVVYRLYKRAYEAGQRNAQPEQRWIPCSKRLPEKDTHFYLTTIANHGLNFTTTLPDDVDVVRWDYDRRKGHNSWHWCTERTVVAWMPLPEPYVERRTNGVQNE